MCWLYACIHLDRQILGILAQAVKADLRLSDPQLGALTASTFFIVYALLGLYFGRVADRADRLVLARTGALVWSLACIAGAFAPTYVWLIASRGGVALGEAIATAATISLMAELAGDRHRALAASIFVAGAFVGAGAAAILGGAILGYLRNSAAWTGWRVAMLAAGAPGIAGAFYLAGFRSPPRLRASNSLDSLSDLAVQHSDRGTGLGLPLAVGCAAACTILIQMNQPPTWSVPLSTALALLVAAGWVRNLHRTDRPAYRATLGQRPFCWLLVSFAAVLFVDCAASFWLIPYAQRHFDIPAASAGARLGSVMIVGGVAGALVGGWIADRWRRVAPSGRVWTALGAVLIEALAILSALASPHYGGFCVAFAAFCVASGGWAGVVAAVAMDLVPAAHRGTGTAAYFLLTTLLGPALGPYIVGLVSDMLESLTRALVLACAASVIAAAGLLGLGRLLARQPGGS